MAVITIELSDAAAARLREAASRARVTEGAVVEAALSATPEDVAAFRAAIAEAEAAVVAGDVVEWDEMMREVEAIIAGAETRAEP